jgi:hypothetical protein
MGGFGASADMQAMAAGHMQLQQHQQQQQHFAQQQSLLQLGSGSMQLGGLSALLAEDEAAAAAAAAAKQALASGTLLQQHAQLQRAPSGANDTMMSPRTSLQQQAQEQQQQLPPLAPQQQQQQKQQQQYDTSAIADCPDLLMRLNEMPQPAVQQVGGCCRVLAQVACAAFDLHGLAACSVMGHYRFFCWHRWYLVAVYCQCCCALLCHCQ